jgi:hypothetical protein
MPALSRSLALSSLLLALYACGTVGTPPAGRWATFPEATPTTVPSASSTPAATAPRSARATWGDLASTGDIVSHLRAASLKVEVHDVPPGSASITLFGAQTTEQFTVENERVYRDDAIKGCSEVVSLDLSRETVFALLFSIRHDNESESCLLTGAGLMTRRTARPSAPLHFLWLPHRDPMVAIARPTAA